jgi:hypothetical protein
MLMSEMGGGLNRSPQHSPHRKIGWLLALKHTAGVDAGLAVHVRETCANTQKQSTQPACPFGPPHVGSLLYRKPNRPSRALP